MLTKQNKGTDQKQYITPSLIWRVDVVALATWNEVPSVTSQELSRSILLVKHLVDRRLGIDLQQVYSAGPATDNELP